MRIFVKKQLMTFREELLEYTIREKLFLFFAMLCSFFICCEYAVVRPVANSLFVAKFGAKYFPYAWLALVPINLVFVNLYNRLIPKWGSRKLFVCLIAIVILSNCTFGALSYVHPSLTFLFYMWKEIYVLLMFQLVWSVVHANVNLSRAKYLYGVIFGFGGMGSMLGSAFPSFFAVSYGTSTLLFLTLPIYGFLFFSYSKMSKYCSGDVPDDKREEKGGVLHGMRLIRRSRFLIFSLLIVLFMQMIAAITDFQLNDFLGRVFPDTDVRTERSGQIMGIIHTLTVSLQFIGTYFLIRAIGFKRLHYSVPMLIAVSASVLLASPVFAAVSLGFITCKTLDFSVFGVIREMLYVPLKPDEKFRAKSVIDVFAYRTSKALSSLTIIAFTSFMNSQSLAWVTLILCFLWIMSVSFGLKEYEKLTTPQEA
jgi:AAA family ATP:ADP antiporter